MESKTFCIMPWVHIHLWPAGEAFLCCNADTNIPLGRLDNTTSIKDIWNCDTMKKTRLDMLAGVRVDACKNCYTIEDLGNRSVRSEFNEVFFQPHVEHAQARTLPDGSVTDMTIKYLDFRFSNLCNLRCRTCGPALSSKWGTESIKLGDLKKDHVVLRNLSTTTINLWDQLLEIIPGVTDIYFAGGEPMLIEEHYTLLKLLISTGQSNHVKLLYNTNFTTLHFKGHSVLELWKHFQHITLGASLDGDGRQGEYIRKDLSWDTILENRKLLNEQCPHVQFFMAVTLSVFNFSMLPEMHRRLVDSGFIGFNDWNINILHTPSFYKVHITPTWYRDKIISEYQDHITWLLTMPNSELQVQRWTDAINFIVGPQSIPDLMLFRSVTEKFDNSRREDFSTTFPELKFLLTT